MWTLAYPWMLALVVLPFVVRPWMRPHRESRSGVRTPFVDRLIQLTQLQPTSGASIPRLSNAQQIMQWTTMLLLLIAAARPQLVEPPITKTVPMRDLMLAVDLSGSMETNDFVDASGQKVDRLTAVKGVLHDFIKRRKDDRLGLIFFGSSPFLQVPLSEDHVACAELLDEAQVRMCGPKTALGDAIGLAMQVFQRSQTKERVLIVLTDGNDTASQVPPVKAAEIAKDDQVVVYCVGVGDPKAAGEEKFDEATLKEVASLTGGEYFHANDRHELESIYVQLDQLQPHKVETISHRPKRDCFYLPLAAALLVNMGFHVVSLIRLSRPALSSDSARPILAKGFHLLALAGPITAFHFIRPWWLLGVIPVTAVVRMIHARRDQLRGWRQSIAPHLLARLAVTESQSQRLEPLALLAVIWCLSLLALAGPTWKKAPSPFASDESSLVIVLECTPTMLARDVQPNRLERATQKIKDLLKRRSGTRTALIAYSGEAHIVMPLTTDAATVNYFAAALTPDVMPTQGDAADQAIELAEKLLLRSGQSGSVLLMTDGITSQVQQKLLKSRSSDGPPVLIWGMGRDRPATNVPTGPPDPLVASQELARMAKEMHGSFTLVSPDDRDVTRMAARVKTNWTPAVSKTGGEQWLDEGYWLTVVIAVLASAWFRPGWAVTYD